MIGIKQVIKFYLIFQVVSLVLAFFFCGGAYLLLKPKPTTPTQMVASWRWYGMFLPDATEVAFLKARLPCSLQSLKAGLKDSNTWVRTCSAQALEGLGPSARPLIPQLKTAYSKESDRLARVYFAKAFGPIGDASPQTMSFLNKAMATESDAEVKGYLQRSIITLGGLAPPAPTTRRFGSTSRK